MIEMFLSQHLSQSSAFPMNVVYFWPVAPFRNRIALNATGIKTEARFRLFDHPVLESDVDRVELFRLTLRFFDDVSTAL